MQDRATGAGRGAVGIHERLVTVVVLGLLGAFIVLGTGFAQSDTLHNAAHDSRHAFAFPCH